MPVDRETWAEEHGYTRQRCPIHGSYYSDTYGCPRCHEREQGMEPQERDDEDDILEEGGA